VDKANKNAWRWFCETHYNDGRGEVEDAVKRNRDVEKRASSGRGQYELFWGLVDKAFEDAKNTHCADSLYSVVSASDFEDYDAWLAFDGSNMTPADRRKLATLVEKMPSNLAQALRYAKTLPHVSDMVQHGLSKGAWIFVGNEPESAL
jgi:hypothetical protein